MQAEPVFLRMNRNRLQPQLGSGPEYSDGDLTTVECKQFFHGKRGSSFLNVSVGHELGKPVRPQFGLGSFMLDILEPPWLI
jgi:hypothetical protein